MKNPLELIEQAKLLQKERNTLQKQIEKLGDEYQNSVNEIMKDELDKITKFTKKLIGDVASVIQKDGYIKIRYRKASDSSRDLYKIKREIENSLNTKSMVILRCEEYNNWGEYRTIHVNFTKGYIKRTKNLPTFY